jgi:hypothetical protein
VLRSNEAPALRPRAAVRTLQQSEGLADAAEVRAFAEDAAAHASLTGLGVNNAPLNEPAALAAQHAHAVVDCWRRVPATLHAVRQDYLAWLDARLDASAASAAL